MPQDPQEQQTPDIQSVDQPNKPSKGLPKINLSKIRAIKSLHLVIIILLIIAAASSFAYYRSQQQLKTLQSTPQEIASNQVKNLVQKVGKLVALPEGEEPTVATITDIEKLKGQTFFANAQNGDKVLIYQGAKKAFLYRPESDKIIEIAPINIGQEQGQVAGETSQKLRFVIHNGTNISGLARRYQDEVKAKIANAEIVSIGDAKNKETTKTFIVSLTDTDAGGIASSLGIEVSTLPAGEPKPDADFLIILGADKSSF